MKYIFWKNLKQTSKGTNNAEQQSGRIFDTHGKRVKKSHDKHEHRCNSVIT